VPYRITKVDATCFPSDEAMAASLEAFGLSADQLRTFIGAFECKAPLQQGVGYQQHIANELERHLRLRLTESGMLKHASTSYSSALNEQADLAVAKTDGGRRLYIEIEFRPNVEKDLVKFQIGWNCELLGTAMLVLAINRRTINAAYTTMPEFAKFARVIRELRPPYPLLLIGISGDHVQARAALAAAQQVFTSIRCCVRDRGLPALAVVCG